MKKMLVLTGGGDCPGLNAVIRALAKRAKREGDWEVWGSIEAFNGILNEPNELVKLTGKKVAGIHVKGGTIIKTTNKGNPTNFPIQKEDGSWENIDRSEELIKKIKDRGFDVVVNIGGDGSQRISQILYEKGLNIIGVPKTIDNDLSATDFTFGFQTAVQIASDSFDKLVTTAESHHRVMILEVMGRDAGWIALHTAISGGAEVCLIPEIPYDVNLLVKRINKRYHKKKGFAAIVVAEGAKPKDGAIVASASGEKGREHVQLGGISYHLAGQLKAAGCIGDIRQAVLGHIQRGGTPIAFDRILASLFGVKAFELALEGKFGTMVTYKNNKICDTDLKDAISDYNYVDPGSFMVRAAKNMGISFGD